LIGIAIGFALELLNKPKSDLDCNPDGDTDSDEFSRPPG
jgi:hypothetical protein